MPRVLRISLLLAIGASPCFGLLMWGIETGIGHVPYDRTDNQGHPMGFNDRLYPNLPEWQVFCFYPMSKRRNVGANWYANDFARRRELMGGHA